MKIVIAGVEAIMAIIAAIALSVVIVAVAAVAVEHALIISRQSSPGAAREPTKRRPRVFQKLFQTPNQLVGTEGTEASPRPIQLKRQRQHVEV